MDFLDLFSNGKSNGPGPRRVDRGSVDKRARRSLASTWRVGARARWCSLVAVEEDELGEAVSKGCSPEHEQ
jgi:hypothetical protein